MTEENEPVGSVAEEAAKLLGALQDWAKESASTDGVAAAAGAASMFGSLNEHIATGDQECRYCPVCLLISAVREVSPEVKQQLRSAGVSLFRAATAAMEANSPGDTRCPGSPVEKIDLDPS